MGMKNDCSSLKEELEQLKKEFVFDYNSLMYFVNGLRTAAKEAEEGFINSEAAKTAHTINKALTEFFDKTHAPFHIFCDNEDGDSFFFQIKDVEFEDEETKTSLRLIE